MAQNLVFISNIPNSGTIPIYFVTFTKDCLITNNTTNQ